MEKENLELKCESLIDDGNGKYISCKDFGKNRYDKGLFVGVHCDSCYKHLIDSSRKRSY